MAYEKEIRFLFEAGGEDWAVLGFCRESIEFEETRKNGQEDCHMWAIADLVDGSWVISEGRQLIDDYGPGAEVIEAFFNENGPPTE